MIVSVSFAFLSVIIELVSLKFQVNYNIDREPTMFDFLERVDILLYL